MKKRLLIFATVIALLIATFVCLTACAPDTGELAGKYELAAITSDDIAYDDIAFCNLILDAKGGYKLEYKITKPDVDNDLHVENGTFSINDNSITFGTGSLSGTYGIDTKRLHVVIELIGIRADVLMVLCDNL